MLFEKGLFSDYSKQELKEVVDTLKKDEELGLLILGMKEMEQQIEQIQRHFTFDCVSAYNFAKKELYDEIAKRYFELDKN
jgi:hypothetical protein